MLSVASRVYVFAIFSRGFCGLALVGEDVMQVVNRNAFFFCMAPKVQPKCRTVAGAYFLVSYLGRLIFLRMGNMRLLACACMDCMQASVAACPLAGALEILSLDDFVAQH